MSEMEEVCSRSGCRGGGGGGCSGGSCRVATRQVQQWRHRVAVRQSFQSVVSQVDGMRHRPLPIRILVPDCREDFVQMEDVGVANECPQYPVPLLFLLTKSAPIFKPLTPFQLHREVRIHIT